MRTRPLPSAAPRTYTQAVLTGDTTTALGLVDHLIDHGYTLADLVAQLLGPTQRFVGEQWLNGAISVAEEHRATTISEAALTRAVAHTAPIAVTHAGGAQVLLTGPEGEWHSLPGRMVAALWAALGWSVTTLTPSLPTTDIVSLVEKEKHSIVAVSCIWPANLARAWMLIEALRSLGCHIMVGGRVFGIDEGICERLGADAHESDPLAAHSVMLGWRSAPPPSRSSAVPPEVAVETNLLVAHKPQIIRDSLQLAEDAGPVPRDAERRAADLVALVDVLTSAVVSQTPSLLENHLAWYADVLALHRDDPRCSRTSLLALRTALPRGANRARAIVDDRLTSQVPPGEGGRPADGG